MIGPRNGVRVFLAAGITDMRCVISGLCARAKRILEEDPASDAVFVFRGRMGDRLKILHWDGQGFCLYDKVLERGYFPWAESHGRQSGPDPGTDVDAVGRDGLASAEVDERAHADVGKAYFSLFSWTFEPICGR